VPFVSERQRGEGKGKGGANLQYYSYTSFWGCYSLNCRGKRGRKKEGGGKAGTRDGFSGRKGRGKGMKALLCTVFC